MWATTVLLTICHNKNELANLAQIIKKTACIRLFLCFNIFILIFIYLAVCLTTKTWMGEVFLNCVLVFLSFKVKIDEIQRQLDFHIHIIQIWFSSEMEELLMIFIFRDIHFAPKFSTIHTFLSDAIFISSLKDHKSAISKCLDYFKWQVDCNISRQSLGLVIS